MDAAAVERSIPLGRWGGGGDMAGAAVYLASRAGAWVTGAVLPVDGGQLTAPIGDPKCVSGGAPVSGKTWSETAPTAQATAGGASSSASASASHHSGPVVRQPNQAVMGAGGGSSATPAYQPVSSLNPYTNRCVRARGCQGLRSWCAPRRPRSTLERPHDVITHCHPHRARAHSPPPRCCRPPRSRARGAGGPSRCA
jgi:hypothetical protein